MGASGGPKMADLTKTALKNLPGHQSHAGRLLVRLDGRTQRREIAWGADNQIAAAVLFGDPFKMQKVEGLDDSKRKEFCRQRDPVCANGGNFMAHLGYGSDAEEAAKFLVDAAGVPSS